MNRFLDRNDRLFESPLELAPRVLLLVATLLLSSIYLWPLWNLTMFAPQYPDGLRLDIYSYKLVGGNNGQDVKEINVLNHYIGMKDLAEKDFTEFKWMPFVVGVIGLLFLRAAVLGRMVHLIDALVVFVYFGIFSLWSFAYKLYSYGHDLRSDAAIRVQGFMPPLFGHRKIANFEIYSFPKPASYFLTAAALIVFAAVIVGWKQGRVPDHGAVNRAAAKKEVLA
jgi:hypothetical protein